jgi:hypothetical protein
MKKSPAGGLVGRVSGDALNVIAQHTLKSTTPNCILTLSPNPVAESGRDTCSLATAAADLTVATMTRTINVLNELIGGDPGFHLT